jgi:hypothetical protein
MLVLLAGLVKLGMIAESEPTRKNEADLPSRSDHLHGALLSATAAQVRRRASVSLGNSPKVRA